MCHVIVEQSGCDQKCGLTHFERVSSSCFGAFFVMVYALILLLRVDVLGSISYILTIVDDKCGVLDLCFKMRAPMQRRS